MNSQMRTTLAHLLERREEINALLADPGVIGDQNSFRDLSIELADISPVVDHFEQYQALDTELAETREMAEDDDPAIRRLASDEMPRLQSELEENAQTLRKLLIPKDPNDQRNIFLEVRAGTGGDEAALFAGDLFRMYTLYAEKRGWQVEIMSQSAGEHGGYKEVISRVAGRGAYSRLKFESGAHRVQRVPETEAQGRIHTSACTVAVMPEADEIDDVEINPADLKIDTYRASGAGGQHVNKTDSAVRLTHLPTGVVVECQDERSQHKNKSTAMKMLKAQLFDLQQKELNKEKDLQISKKQENAWGSQIRSYILHPYQMVKDHRTNLESGNSQAVLNGELNDFIKAALSQKVC